MTVDRFRRLYGAPPAHLAGLLVSFLVAGYAAWWLFGSRPLAVLVWFVGAAVLHDLVLAPVYLLLDRVGRRRRTVPPWWNHVRVPAAISLLLLLVWAPEILQRSRGYRVTTGLSASVYAGRWLAVTGVLFGLSALLYGIGRLRRARRRRPAAAGPAGPAR